MDSEDKFLNVVAGIYLIIALILALTGCGSPPQLDPSGTWSVDATFGALGDCGLEGQTDHSTFRVTKSGSDYLLVSESGNVITGAMRCEETSCTLDATSQGSAVIDNATVSYVSTSSMRLGADGAITGTGRSTFRADASSCAQGFGVKGVKL